MRFLLPVLFVTLLACSSSENNGKSVSQKGSNLRTNPAYENVKSLANAVRSGVLDSCIISSTIGFDEMVKLTPKMNQIIKHADYTTKTCKFVNTNLGDIAQWSLVEAFKSKDRLLNIFRYKLISKKFDFPIELRITLTDQNKLTEYRFYKWEETYSEDLIKMNWN